MYVNQKSTETKEGWYLSNKIKLTTSTYQPYISIVTFNVILNFDLTSSYLEYNLSLQKHQCWSVHWSLWSIDGQSCISYKLYNIIMLVLYYTSKGKCIGAHTQGIDKYR